MKIAVLNLKGGTAKTTTAMHLAAELATRGPTLLIDSDPNLTATKWAARARARGEPFPFDVAQPLDATARDTPPAHTIYDLPGTPTDEDLAVVARRCQIIVLPAEPEPLALDATVDAVRILRGINPDVRLLVALCIVPPAPAKAGDDAAEFLVARGVPLAKTRVRRYGVAHAAATARGVLLHAITSEPRAAADLDALCAEVLHGW